MVLTCIFWALFLLPGLALGFGCFPGLGRLGGVVRWPCGSGLLSVLAHGYAASLLLMTPWSLLGYAFGAPLRFFSAALCVTVALGALGLSWAAVKKRAVFRRPRLESWAAYALLAWLLWLQSRLGGWLDGDATVHVGRMRVLLEHGFSNRDIYLADYRFHHAYPNNLLIAVYASAAQLTGQSELASWFHTEVWAKLCVAGGHAVLAERVTGRRSVGVLLALAVLTLSAGETYALYPNTLSVGFLLPMLLGWGFTCFSADAPSERGVPLALVWSFALTWLLGQVHGAYAVYGMLLLGPWFGLGLLASWLSRPARPLRRRALAALLCLTAALPFVLVSAFGFRDPRALTSAPADATPPPVEPLPRAGTAPAHAADARVPIDAVTHKPSMPVLGGHLEQVLDVIDDRLLHYDPERMGGRGLVWTGAAGLALAIALYAGRRWPLTAAALAAALLAVVLFSAEAATAASALLGGAFLVARLSTLLTTLLALGLCACLAWPLERLRRARSWPLSLLSLSLTAAAACLPAHAPESFRAHVQRALAPAPKRYAYLDMLLSRRRLLREHVPAGSTVLSTARFGRQIVMLRDCYILAADRGHTHVVGVDNRRRDLVFLNAAATPWRQRARLLRHYDVQLVVFERRWQRRYAWAYQHGTLLGHAAGLDVVELDLR